MRRLLGTLAGAALVMGLSAGPARAGETVFTDQGWYRVEGNAPTPAPDQNPDALQTMPAPPVAAAPAAQPSMPVRPPPPPMLPPPPPAQSCLEERGALTRRLLSLHGLELSKTQLSDAQLGAMGLANLAAPMPFTASLTLDPDLNLLAGNVPIPPSSANWDEEVRQDWQALVDCESD